MRFLLAVLFLLVAHDDTFAKPKPAPSPKPNPEPWHVFLNGQRPGMNMGGTGMQGGMGMNGGMGMGGMGPLPIRPPANTWSRLGNWLEQVRKLYKKQSLEIKQRKYHLNLQESIYSYFASKKRFPMCPMKCPRPLPYFRLIVVHTRYLNIIYLWE